MIKRLLFLAVLAVVFVATVKIASTDEGMYPLSMLHKLDLKSKGMKLEPNELYNPQGVSLIDAVVSLGGCTGSFVSPDGLILTNHHCVFGSVQAISSKEKDFISNGFLAQTREEEVPARDMTVRIAESYTDVSADVLSALNDAMAPEERAAAIGKRLRAMTAEAEKKNPGKRIEIAEMFQGKSYVMFVYAVFRDVRLVYVPPRSIGEFGGENDNWVWPRHTGDFSFIRAYTAPDGSPAAYSKSNVPYHPKRWLKVQPKGVNEGDFVFILGYPGGTSRHRSSYYMEMDENYRLPFMHTLFDRWISIMEDAGKKDKGLSIMYAANVKGYANATKLYRGQLQGMKRLGLVEKKREEEQRMQAMVDADPALKAKYGKTLGQTAEFYKDMAATMQRDMVLDAFRRSSAVYRIALSTVMMARSLQMPDSGRAEPYKEAALEKTRASLVDQLGSYNRQTDRLILKELFMRGAALRGGDTLPAFTALFGEGEITEQKVDAVLDDMYEKTVLADKASLAEFLKGNPAAILASKDPFVTFVLNLLPTMEEVARTRAKRQGTMLKLAAEYIEIKQLYQKSDFIPDANSTLRLTYGYIKGYSPADAVYCEPMTTLTGVIEKTTSEEPYNTPQKVVELYRAKKFAPYKHPAKDDVPVAILYNTDTIGGNSGSPVMNASGELIGVNFDRTFEGTINDYTWNERYSRSIAVDIRYVLWVTENIGGAAHIINELGVK